MRFTEPVLAQVLDDTEDGQAGEPGEVPGQQCRQARRVSPASRSRYTTTVTIGPHRNNSLPRLSRDAGSAVWSHGPMSP